MRQYLRKDKVTVNNNITVNCNAPKGTVEFFGHTKNGEEVRTIAGVTSNDGRYKEIRLDPKESRETHLQQARKVFEYL